MDETACHEDDADTFSVIAGGDVLVHPPVTDQALADAGAAGGTEPDFRPILAGVKPAVSRADLAICHLETPLAPVHGPFAGYRRFNAPPQIAAALKDLGFHTCSTASNHTLDQGEAGVHRTLEELDATGIGHTGSARSAAEADRLNVIDVKGVPVAHLSYTYGFNDTALPDGRPWLANLYGDRVLAEARRARAAGAEAVILSMHWGREYQSPPSPRQIRMAAELTAGPEIDLVIGHHTHVVQPFERVNGRWVAYGLGNLIARHRVPRGSTEEGAMAWFRFVREGGRWRVRSARCLPVLIELDREIRTVDLAAARRDPALPADRRRRYRQAGDRIRRAALGRGAGNSGLREPG
ncbi:CapA family protein [Streptomyces luteireticuli]|uniref:CapA family protein n=1 Tax=Streptomyces luteireticuli TaxID=173858 RepID=A0ABN0YG87_9ACTN